MNSRIRANLNGLKAMHRVNQTSLLSLLAGLLAGTEKEIGTSTSTKRRVRRLLNGPITAEGNHKAMVRVKVVDIEINMAEVGMMKIVQDVRDMAWATVLLAQDWEWRAVLC